MRRLIREESKKEFKAFIDFYLFHQLFLVEVFDMLCNFPSIDTIFFFKSAKK